MNKTLALLIFATCAMSLNAEPITKSRVCSMIDALSTQLNVQDLGNDRFALTYNGGKVYKFDNFTEYKKFFVECYDEDKLIARIIDKGKIIARERSSIPNNEWVTFKHEGCTLTTSHRGDVYVPMGNPKCFDDKK